MKKGLVLEGGAMRGMFTAGVMDVLMENDITFDGAIGTSAGAAFGCNYKSHQIGRVIRYNKKYCRDKRFVSLRSLITTGDLYGADFAYRELPRELDIFDTDTFSSSPMEFYITCTDVETGEAVYRKCEKGDDEDLLWMRASASLPLASRIVEIGERKFMDGGMADSISVKHLQSLGYDRNVVVLTQPLDYEKKKNKLLPILKLVYKKYPKFIKALETRHERYNETLQYIKDSEKKKEIYVIRPPYKLEIGAVEHDPEKLQKVYDIGRREAEKHIEEIKEFLNV
ncbi:MAG: patatin family protein [Clostridia bacterium]|nr:patatin family protein [Clostridia bacterium]